jgi:hypothetical protein
MSQSSSTIKGNFPYPALTLIGTSSAPPTPNSIQLLQTQFIGNAASVHSATNAWGLLPLVLTPAAYLLLAVTPFTLPTYHVHSATSANTGPVIQEANHQYILDLKVFVKQLVAVTPLAYISELGDPDLGYTNVTIPVVNLSQGELWHSLFGRAQHQ